LENEIFWEGIAGKYEKKSIELWIMLSRYSGIIIDIGANTGIYALSAQCINPQAKVYAFEPIQRVYEMLVANNKLNRFNIGCIKKAVSMESGYVEVYDVPLEIEYTVSLEYDILKDEQNSIIVQLEKIDLATFIEEERLSQIDLIKMDVEYHEYQVLKGMKGYLKQMRPDMLIEIVDEDLGEKINTSLTGLDYKYFNIDDKNNNIIEVAKISKSFTYNYLICKEESAKKIGLIT
jgi:FkbM family methyltransferase